jgi:tetratricopeptide (TPR) repeat protein
MRRLLFCLLLAITCSNSSAQNAITDSIRVNFTRLEAERSDTGKAKILYLLSYYYQFYNLDSSLVLARSAYSISLRSHFIKGQARSLGMIAGTFNKLGNYAKALQYYLDGLKVLEKLKDPDDISRAYLNIALVYSSKKEIPTALEYMFRSDSIARQYKLNDLIVYIDLDIGNMYTEEDQLDSALIYTRLALDSSLSQKNDVITGTAWNNLGNIYSKKGQYDIAIENYNKAVPFLVSMQDYNNLSECYLGLSKAFGKKENWDSALVYANRSYRLAADNGFLQQSVNASQYLADVFKQHDQIDSAFLYQQTYMALKDSFDNSEKLKELQNLTISEEIRQEEIVQEKKQLEKERKVKLQLLLLGMFIPVFFLITAFISKKKVNKRVIELSGIFSIIFLFEYITLLIHPVVAARSGHSPIIEIVIFVALAAILSPTHHKVQHWFVNHLTKRHHHSTNTASTDKEKKEHP